MRQCFTAQRLSQNYWLQLVQPKLLGTTIPKLLVTTARLMSGSCKSDTPIVEGCHLASQIGVHNITDK